MVTGTDLSPYRTKMTVPPTLRVVTTPVLFTVATVGSTGVYVVPEDFDMFMTVLSANVPNTLKVAPRPILLVNTLVGSTRNLVIAAAGSTSRLTGLDFPGCWPDRPPIAVSRYFPAAIF